MKFNFKIQQYQTDAVEAVARVFTGQGLHEKVGYRRDIGKRKKSFDFQGNEIDQGIQMKGFFDEDEADLLSDIGYKNELIDLTDEQLLQNIQQLQNESNIKLSNSLVKSLGQCSLDIEMERDFHWA